MLAKLLPTLCLLTVLASCSTAYKNTQTPDDLYYADAVVKTTRTEERREDTREERRDRYETPTTAQDDRYLRMKVRNRDRWDCLDDYDYWYDPRFDYSIYSPNRFDMWNRWNTCGCGTNVWMRPNTFWGGWSAYNPYVTVATFKNPRLGSTSASTVRAFNNTRIANSNGTQVYDAKTGRSTWRPALDRGSSIGTNQPTRTFGTGSTPSSSAGGRSGGFGSSGSSSGGGRAGRN